MAKYRVWVDHAESDCHQWASDLIHTDILEAEREWEQLQDTSDGYAEYTIFNLETGYPYNIQPEIAEKFGYRNILR